MADVQRRGHQGADRLPTNSLYVLGCSVRPPYAALAQSAGIVRLAGTRGKRRRRPSRAWRGRARPAPYFGQRLRPRIRQPPAASATRHSVDVGRSRARTNRSRHGEGRRDVRRRAGRTRPPGGPHTHLNATITSLSSGASHSTRHFGHPLAPAPVSASSLSGGLRTRQSVVSYARSPALRQRIFRESPRQHVLSAGLTPLRQLAVAPERDLGGYAKTEHRRRGHAYGQRHGHVENF